MENQNIKRGVDLNNRLLEGKWANDFRQVFLRWQGEDFSKLILFFLPLVCVINLLEIYPIFQRDVSSSFSSSLFTLVAEILTRVGISSGDFFSFLTFTSLMVLPISAYFFFRRMALRHEIIAFLATLVFIIPNPLLGNEIPAIHALFQGDGAYLVAFSIMPLLLLFIHEFIALGKLQIGTLSAVGIAAIAVISPFAMFNLLIFLGVIAVSEGFVGNFRTKISRSIFLLLSAFALSFFWYFPNLMTKIVLMSHVKFTIQQFLGMLPILIPVVPIAGALSFLVFDGRGKLKPIFVGLSSFATYLWLYLISKHLNIVGIFTAERYYLGLVFTGSFLFAVLSLLLAEFLARTYFSKYEKDITFLPFTTVCMIIVAGLGIFSLFTAPGVHLKIATAPLVDHYNIGIGNMDRIYNSFNFSSLFAGLVSAGALIALIINTYFRRSCRST